MSDTMSDTMSNGSEAGHKQLRIGYDTLWDEAEARRIATLKVALKAGLLVMREWINRARRAGGYVDIGDINGAEKLYRQMLHAYRGEEQEP